MNANPESDWDPDTSYFFAHLCGNQYLYVKYIRMNASLQTWRNPVIIFITICFAGLEQSQGQFSQGPSNSSFITEEFAGCLACPGSSWSSPSDAVAPDGLFAATQLSAYPTCFQGTCYYSRGLMAQQFGFSIPSSAVITGVKAEVLRKAGAANIGDSTIRLLINGNAAGQSKALAGNWPLAPAYVTYGDSLSTWGLTLTPALVNDSAFGIRIQPLNKSLGVATFITAYVDHVQLTVYYTTTSGVNEHQVSSSLFQGWYDASGDAIVMQPSGTLNGAYELHLLGETGQLVYSGTGFSGSSRQVIPAGSLKSGMYQLTLKSGQLSFTKTLVITR